MEFYDAMQMFLKGKIVLDTSKVERNEYKMLLYWLADQGIYFFGTNGVFVPSEECIRYNVSLRTMFCATRYYYEERHRERLDVIGLDELYFVDTDITDVDVRGLEAML